MITKKPDGTFVLEIKLGNDEFNALDNLYGIQQGLIHLLDSHTELVSKSGPTTRGDFTFHVYNILGESLHSADDIQLKKAKIEKV